MTKDQDKWAVALAGAQDGLRKFKASGRRVQRALNRMRKALSAVGGSHPLTEAEQREIDRTMHRYAPHCTTKRRSNLIA